GSAILPEDPGLVQSILRDAESGEIRPEFRNVLPDEKHAIIPVMPEGMYFAGDDIVKLIEETDRAVVEAGFVEVQAVLTGPPAFMSQIEDIMTRSMSLMFVASLLLMFLILALIFKVRGFFAWRWLPLGAVGLGVIYAFGAFGLLGIPITMVSMSAFPILVGLGVDYSIQLHNRYDEEMRNGATPSTAVMASLTRVGPAIGIAAVAVCLSFAAMVFSPIPMIRDFGLMLLVGVIACFLVAMFFPLTIVYWRARRAQHEPGAMADLAERAEPSEGLLEKALRRSVPVVIRHPAIVIFVALSLSVAGFVADSQIETETDETRMISENVVAMKDYQTLKEVMSGVVTLNVLVEADDVTDPEVISWIADYDGRVSREMQDNVVTVDSFTDLVVRGGGIGVPETPGETKQVLQGASPQIRRNLVNDDFTAANIVVGLLNTDQNEVEQLRHVEEQLRDLASSHPEGVTVAITGASSLGPDLLDAFTSGRFKMTMIGVGFVFLALLVLFRFSILKAFMATLPIGLIIGWSSGLMYVGGIKYTPLTACLGLLILGIGVEYTILLMMRYYEERGKGVEAGEAMVVAVTRIGRPILASGLTTIGGFAALMAATDFLILRYFGLMTVIDVSLALASTLFILPPLIVWADSWRGKRQLAREEVESVKAAIVESVEQELKEKVRSA
ncbi:MAG: hydrophobe/amphiphile efflux-3 (HAE3) family transporter, partial [Dehalococcoidia bacterium]